MLDTKHPVGLMRALLAFAEPPGAQARISAPRRPGGRGCARPSLDFPNYEKDSDSCRDQLTA